ncbi:MAG: biosynthetic peptidoglycan transglycosylase [Bdellovibrionota bacterium]
MRKFLRFFAYAFSFVIGAAATFFIAATVFDMNVLGLFLTSATKVVGVFGEKFPALHTKYGELRIRSSSSPKGQYLEIACASCNIDNPLLSSVPFRTQSGLLRGFMKNDHFAGEAILDQVTANIEAEWQSYSATGSFDLKETEIQKIYLALKSIVPEAEQAKITGTVKGRGRFTWPHIMLQFEPKVKDFTVSGLIDTARYKSGQFDYHAEDADGNDIVITGGEGTANWLPLKEIGPHLPAAIIAIEDRGFYNHPGFDIESIVSATHDNKRLGRLKRGGSTLTQQLAKNLFLTDEKTYARKLRELLYAVEIDKELGKKRELELYLNIVEWGPNIYGAKAACQTYFHKLPSQLSPEEAAWLAAILRSPKKDYERQYKANRPNMVLVSYALRYMRSISDEERQAAMGRPILFAH